MDYRFSMGLENTEPMVKPALNPEPKPAAASSAAVKGGKARMLSMSKAERQLLGRQAAEARWGGQKQAAAAKPKAGSRRSAAKRGGAKARVFAKADKVFGVALVAAERRLAKAIEERARAASTWAVLNAEIPSLQRTIAALRNQQNPANAEPSYEQQLPDGSRAGVPSPAGTPNYDLAAVVSDAPVPALHPLRASRAAGGAIGVDLADEGDDEDRFLRDSSVAAGQWH